MHGIWCHMLHIYYMKSQLACVACVACVLPHSLESWHQNKSDKKSCSAYHVVSISKRLYLPSGPVSPSNVRSQQHPLLDLGSIMLQHATAQSLQMSSSHLTELVESIWLDFNRFSQGALHVFKPWNRIKQPSSHGKEKLGSCWFSFAESHWIHRFIEWRRGTALSTRRMALCCLRPKDQPCHQRPCQGPSLRLLVPEHQNHKKKTTKNSKRLSKRVPLQPFHLLLRQLLPPSCQVSEQKRSHILHSQIINW